MESKESPSIKTIAHNDLLISSEKNRTENSLQRSNQLLQMLNKCSQAMIYISDKTTLLQKLCSIIRQGAGYCMVIFDSAEQDDPLVLKTTVMTTANDEFFQQQFRDYINNELEINPAVTAIRNKSYFLAHNISTERWLPPSQIKTKKPSTVSVCALNITVGENNFGVLSVYSTDTNSFDTEELTLLKDLTYNLACSILRLHSHVQSKYIKDTLKLTQFAVDCSADAIFLITPDSRFSYVNEAACNSLGYSRDELLSMSVCDIDPDIPKEFVHQIFEDLKQKRRIQFETFHRRKNGTTFPVEVVANFMDYNGKAYNNCFARDISDRKRVELELQQHREHLEELVEERTSELRLAMAKLVQSEKLAALGNLVAGVAHELNTPLGISRTVASTLGDSLSDLKNHIQAGTLRRSQLEEFLETSDHAVTLLDRNTSRAAELISHFKQVAVDQTSTRRRCFFLYQITEELLSTLKPQIKQTLHQVKINIPPDIEMDSYPGPIEQIITNLVTNSLTHGFNGISAGQILIQTKKINDTQIILRYSDNGTGIPEKILGQIFDPFFTTKLGQGGSGLGLSIVYNLVTNILAGSINVKSTSEHGTEFTITLPITAPIT